MLKVADSVALQFQSFQRLMYTVLKRFDDTPASSTKPSTIVEGFFNPDCSESVLCFN